MSAVRWLVKCGAAAAIVLIACGFATMRFGSGLQMPATTTRDGTLITLSRYLRSRIYADRALQQFNAEDPTDAARFNVERIEELSRVMEQRGARVFLFELPYAEPIEGSRHAATTREIIHAAFPDSNRWLPIEVNRSELRWADGVHLDERSAVIVTQAMERALAAARTVK
jgi:hypothetical protein